MLQRSRVSERRGDLDAAYSLARQAARVFDRYDMASMSFRCRVLQAAWGGQQLKTTDTALARRMEWSAELDLLVEGPSKPLPLVL